MEIKDLLMTICPESAFTGLCRSFLFKLNRNYDITQQTHTLAVAIESQPSKCLKRI